MRFIIILLITLANAYPAFAVYNLKPGDMQITDFEFHPNCLSGNAGAYGAITGSGYTDECAYTGNKSYKLVFAKDVVWKPEYEVKYDTSRSGMKKMDTSKFPDKPKKIDWAVFILDMGPILDDKSVPVKIQSLDISEFRYIAFWIRGHRGGEEFKIHLRDVHANTYEPQLKIDPNIMVTNRWKPVALSIKRMSRKIDIKNIVQIGIGFGREDGNKTGNIMYVDNFILVK